MFALLIVIIGLIGLLLGVIILLQSGKGGGLAGIAAGGATQQMLGTRTAPDILEKATWTLGALFILLCVMTNFTIDREEGAESVIQQGQAQESAPPVLPPSDAIPAPPPSAGDQSATDDGGGE
ncbi:MAG: preprotein translocase subunit SecG [Rhodothermales bacterium]|nr:preprotein translocase subunit SecG [Rhodothermales bacterium]